MTDQTELPKKKPKIINLESTVIQIERPSLECLSERTNFLYTNGRDMIKKRELKANDNKKKKINDELKKCTFKPKVNPIEKLAQIFTISSENLSNYHNTSTTSEFPYVDRIYNWQTMIKEK